ncbi:TonB-dependent receptor [Phenylobacterium hankyongense]|uniref:TonB-dependent receptor n=1 Tax=Phenylobacterium hankyongense TaxID=1813876 RepID=A0A328AVL8_9CAUL|nr:TonB-dependent receptor [Phenylobacterium hankyongense]RAK59120.1 TonB-dependent receptor [Phenylobacterium hankyongense]
MAGSRRLAARGAVLMTGAATAALLALSPGQARADDAPQVSEIVVTGEAYSIQKAINAKRAATAVSDSISASEMGSIPEFGLGEALMRVPGVAFQINNGRGEAQFMTLRGLNPDYNSVTLDGIALPSTEETRRQVSFDVLPSIIADQVSVYKTYTADQPSDAIGGVTDLKTHSAFDHPGLFVAGHVDYASWDNKRTFQDNPLSGQGDLRISKTFGANDQFGVLALASYYVRYSNSLNSYSLPYSYYNYSGAGTQTVNATALTPTTNVNGLTPIPDRRRWYYYDNRRIRPGGYLKFEYDDHERFSAHLSGGAFEHTNDEDRYSQYVNRGAATATFNGPNQATFATGSAESDFDLYHQYRNITFIQADAAYKLDEATRLQAVANYARGFYRQDTTEDVFTTPTNATFAPVYVGNVQGIPLLSPANPAAFGNPANYLQNYHLLATDKSVTKVPQVRIDLIHEADGDGFGYRVGLSHKETRQQFSYNEVRLNAAPGANVTLARAGVLDGSITPPDSNGQALTFVDPAAVASFVAANPSLYVLNNSTARNTLNNFFLREKIDGGYAEASYRSGPLYLQGGLRYERTTEEITNFQPSPLTSTTNFAAVQSNSGYSKPLPEVNVSYDLSDTVRLRAAVSQTLARPRYSDLAQNVALTLSGSQATETVANPGLQPREAINYDLSFEWYPQAGASVSVALFEKDIQHEIFALTTTQQGVPLPGQTGTFTLTTTRPSNLGDAKVRGIEFGVNLARLDFLPGRLANLGVSANATLIQMDAPSMQMADGVTYRQLPQLLESAKDAENLTVFYHEGKLSGEVAYNHTGKMPLAFDRTNAVNDQWYRATDTLDAQLSYQIRRGLELRLQAKNLTNETNQKIVGPGQNLNYSLLENGRAYYAGVSFAF